MEIDYTIFAAFVGMSGGLWAFMESSFKPVWKKVLFTVAEQIDYHYDDKFTYWTFRMWAAVFGIFAIWSMDSVSFAEMINITLPTYKFIGINWWDAANVVVGGMFIMQGNKGMHFVIDVIELYLDSKVDKQAKAIAKASTPQ